MAVPTWPYLEDVIVNPEPGHAPAPKPVLADKPTNKRIWQITAGVALITGIVITYLSINKNPPPVVGHRLYFQQ
jgi:hypothetical protein